MWLAQQTAFDLWQARKALKKARALAAVRSAGRRTA
jgi:plasmid maintenance system antidote protein VapI